MSKFDYGRLKATADRLLARYGSVTQAVLLEPTSTGPTYDPTPGAPNEYPTDAVILDYNSHDIDGTRIMMGDRRAYVAIGSLTIQPKTDWLLRIGGQDYRIININTLQPGDVKLLWDIQCRVA